METRQTLKENNEKYSNCKVYHPNGKLMFVNSQKKGKWYVEKTNATILEYKENGDLAKIQLTFIPKGKGFDKNDVFGTSVHKVQCVVTAEDDITKLTKHHVVPYSYRKFMPEEYKSHTSHDVVYLSVDKHDEYEHIAYEFRTLMHKKYNIPTVKEGQRKETEDIKSFGVTKMKRILSYIKIVLQNSDHIPRERLALMYNDIVEFAFEKYLFTEDDLLGYFTDLQRRIEEDLEEISKKVKVDVHESLINKILEIGRDELDSFIVEWRKHFIETMSPQYMPKGWDVNRSTTVNINK